LRIEVKDNGPGIASDKQAIIFDEFVRLQIEDDAPREERGLGLGLAIVDRIARMLDLPVGLASAPGQGSTFSVTVQRVPAVVASADRAPRAAAHAVDRGRELRALHRQRGPGARGDGDPARRLGLAV